MKEKVEKEASKTADMKAKCSDPYDLKQQIFVYTYGYMFNVLARIMYYI